MASGTWCLAVLAGTEFVSAVVWLMLLNTDLSQDRRASDARVEARFRGCPISDMEHGVSTGIALKAGETAGCAPRSGASTGGCPWAASSACMAESFRTRPFSGRAVMSHRSIGQGAGESVGWIRVVCKRREQSCGQDWSNAAMLVGERVAGGWSRQHVGGLALATLRLCSRWGAAEHDAEPQSPVPSGHAFEKPVGLGTDDVWRFEWRANNSNRLELAQGMA
ncbi:hypothetical protein P171DRAFT_449931 [Karstenula rhodostoma CBS 690.94]|uniref:Uncharacterized protein n=1 Tax=Karstenula rhodostoma CBS 690.94 TaxID=1392251 RepID=A0A9P4U5Q2_9PLEO|nr:hypothetical protein P171DRAFT_449931 [Karstenula rhodostoma CBS 690.94]